MTGKRQEYRDRLFEGPAGWTCCTQHRSHNSTAHNSAARDLWVELRPGSVRIGALRGLRGVGGAGRCWNYVA